MSERTNPLTGRAARRRPRARLLAAALAAIACLAVVATATAAPGEFKQTNLVSDVPGMALNVDANLVNPWGLSSSPTSPIWVANNVTSTSTLYRGFKGDTPLSIVPLVVQVPGRPTGTVWNGTDGFVVFVSDDSGASGAAAFLFATLSGQILGWNAAVPPPAPSMQAQVAVTTPGAVYTGLTLGTSRGASFLYAANFAAGTVDVFDSSFAPVATVGGFVDHSLPDEYGPFNVQELGGKIYVAYAKREEGSAEEDPGPGRGFVDVFSTRGELLSRLVSRDGLNAPWGLAIAPNGFGQFGGALLVGNFGNGRIHAYDKTTGALLGTMEREGGGPLVIDGLWGLRFGNGTIGAKKTLFFAAGIAEETHGLFGAITPDV
jgi:uncharacterized protein (TIGR03118 family)